MAFPYNSEGQLNNTQAILGGTAGISASGDGFLRVSAVNAITTTTSPISADSSSVSAKQGDAGNLRVSAIQDNATNLNVSAKSGDAALFRVSALGVTATVAPLSADSSSVSAKQGDAANLRISGFSLDAGTLLVSAKQGDAALFRVSAIIDSGSVSARSGDANQVHVSAVQGDAGLLHVSVVGTLLVSAHEVKQSDAASLRVSAILAAGVSSVGAASFGVSAAQNDAGALHVSAYSGDGNQLHVSSVQGDAGLLHTSAYAGDANQQHVSAVQGDAALFRVSSFLSVATTNTGGASVAFTSSGLGTQVSTAKSTAGRLYGYHIYNPAGVDQFLQVFNTSAGAAGGDANYMNLGIPTGGGAVMSLGDGIAFSNGIQFVGTSTRNGNTMGASAMIINLFYA